MGAVDEGAGLGVGDIHVVCGLAYCVGVAGAGDGFHPNPGLGQLVAGRFFAHAGEVGDFDRGGYVEGDVAAAGCLASGVGAGANGVITLHRIIELVFDFDVEA